MTIGRRTHRLVVPVPRIDDARDERFVEAFLVEGAYCQRGHKRTVGDARLLYRETVHFLTIDNGSGVIASEIRLDSFRHVFVNHCPKGILIDPIVSRFSPADRVYRVSTLQGNWHEKTRS